MTVDELKDALYWDWRKKMRDMECRRESFWVPQENRFGENWTWEDSGQCYELDTEFQDRSYFENMDPDDLCHLVRHMENFMMERGITMAFFRNYAKADHAFEALDKQEPADNYPF